MAEWYEVREIADRAGNPTGKFRYTYRTDEPVTGPHGLCDHEHGTRGEAVACPVAKAKVDKAMRRDLPDDEPDRNAHSPQLDEPLRSRERAALDIAVLEIRAIELASKDMGYPHLAKVARHILDKIAALVPDAVK